MDGSALAKYAKQSQTWARWGTSEDVQASGVHATPYNRSCETKPTCREEAVANYCIGKDMAADGQVRKTKPDCRVGPTGALACRDAISCVSGVSAGPVHSMQADAKCCVSTEWQSFETKPTTAEWIAISRLQKEGYALLHDDAKQSQTRWSVGTGRAFWGAGAL